MVFMESKEQKFKRLAEARTNKALQAIGSISKLSNRGHYDFNEAEVREILSALRHAVEEARARFDLALKQNAKTKFHLKGE